MENQVLLDNDIREFYQSWFNSLSKHIHYIEFRLDDTLNSIYEQLDTIDYRFTLLEDRLLKLEDRFNNLNKNTSTNG